jgi:membrane-bound metal-dependent hydrolase YbcI (DUF457 family)
MKPTGHLAGGYLVTRLWLKQIKPDLNRNLLLAAGTLAGMLPDTDTLYHLARTRSLEFGADFDHHRWITHTFPFYLIPGLLVYGYGRFAGRSWLGQLSLVSTTAAVTHLLQDAIGSGTGLMWAWPFSRRMGGVCTLHVEGGRAWLEAYERHPIAWVERLIVLAAVGMLIMDFLKKSTATKN